jgi:hypothetical protein
MPRYPIELKQNAESAIIATHEITKNNNLTFEVIIFLSDGKFYKTVMIIIWYNRGHSHSNWYKKEILCERQFVFKNEKSSYMHAPFWKAYVAKLESEAESIGLKY